MKSLHARTQEHREMNIRMGEILKALAISGTTQIRHAEYATYQLAIFQSPPTHDTQVFTLKLY